MVLACVLALQGGAAAGELDVTAHAAGSSRIAVSWPRVAGAQGIRVFVSPEPPQADSLTARLPVAELEGTATRFLIRGLAPAADVFVRVEARLATSRAVGDAHGRTPGGPRVPLDTPVREVHAMAPNVLAVVVANEGAVHAPDRFIHDTGPEWQQGKWQIRRHDGTGIGVRDVHRHSIPVGQPQYAVGPNLPYDNTVVDVDHWIYLVLEERIGSADMLQVSGPRGLVFLLPFSDRYLETPVVQVNQVGYSPHATKRWAYVSGWLGDGGPLSMAGFPAAGDVLVEPDDPMQPRRRLLADVPIVLLRRDDPEAGADVSQLDLSGLAPDEGARYRVRIPGVGVSWRTAVSEAAVRKAFYTTARGLYYNRWGRDLRMPYSEFERRPDHPTVFTADVTGHETAAFDASMPRTGERSLRGGHHDAGDFDIRYQHFQVAHYLMQAYEVNPNAYLDGQLDIPESGNGIPDLLDEALWSIAGWEQLQEADGGVRMGVETYRHPAGYYYADEDPLPYWTYARSAVHSARVAGLFAQAARLVAPFDSVRSSALRERAKAAFAYARQRGVDPASARGNVFYPAGELFRLTSDASYRDVIKAAYSAEKWGKLDLFFGAPWSGAWTLKDFPVMPSLVAGLAGADGVPLLVRSQIQQATRGRAIKEVGQTLVSSVSAHRQPSPRRFPLAWGQATALGQFLTGIYGDLQLRDMRPTERQDYYDAISVTADWILGCNPAGMVWITGLGSRYPREPLHLDALSFIKEGRGVLPGIPVFGPYDGKPPWYAREAGDAFYPPWDSQPRLRRYADTRTFVHTNEFDVSMMALQTQLFGTLLPENRMRPPTLPSGGMRHGVASGCEGGVDP